MSQLEAVALQITGLVQNAQLDPVVEADRRLHELLQRLPAAIYTTDAAGRITFYNEAAVALWGCRPRLNSDQWCGSWRLYRPDGTPLPHDQCPMAIALKEHRAINGGEAVAERPDGTRVPFMAFPSPLTDEGGRLVGAVNMLVDASERQHDEQIRQRLASIVESCDDAIVSKNLDGIITTWNAGAQRLFGYSGEEVIGKPITMLIPLDRQNEEPQILESIRRGERVDHYETVRRRKDGSLVDISLTVSPVKNAQGKVVGASKIARDITEREHKEAHVALLAREVDHRAKNLLALVQATVHLTQADTADELKAAIAGRLQALANAHTLLSRSRWEGADMRSLVCEELSPHCREGGPRADIQGPDLVLEPMAAQSIAVALHELTTNAVKYGALSTATGRVRIAWQHTPKGELMLRWVETGGPPVKPPTRRGFGTNVIDRMIHDQLRGTARFDWHPAGLICEITTQNVCSAVLPIAAGTSLALPKAG